jgi:hypothetical protein
MFIRVKTSPKTNKKAIQIVESKRIGNKIVQNIIRHIGMASNDEEVEKLKEFAIFVKTKLEQTNQLSFYSIDELIKLNKNSLNTIKEDDYKIDFRESKEEKRIITGIHDVYGKLFDELGYNFIFHDSKKKNNTKQLTDLLRNIVLARIACPLSKRASVDLFEKKFGVSLNLDKIYRIMDKLDKNKIDNIKYITANNTKSLFSEKIDLLFFDVTTLYFESFMMTN